MDQKYILCKIVVIAIRNIIDQMFNFFLLKMLVASMDQCHCIFGNIWLTLPETSHKKLRMERLILSQVLYFLLTIITLQPQA